MSLLLLLFACGDLPDRSQGQPLEDPLIDTVCINEVMARTELVDPGVDWLELSGDPGPLEGWSLLTNRDDPEPFALDDLAIPDERYLLIPADMLPFGLDVDGDAVGLEAPDGSREWVEWGQLPTDHSVARVPDCCRSVACWEIRIGGTPGRANTAPN